MDYTKKNGLLYSNDLRTVEAVDTDSNEFTGRIPFGARYIEDEVFADSPYESISLPDSVEHIGACLFQNSTALERVKLSENLKELSPYLFSGCVALQKVSMPLVVPEFPEGLFYGCSSLLEIPFRAGIKSLPENVFAGCASIQSLVIPDTVESIGSRAVADCTSLTTVVLPAALYELADDAFEGCKSISKIRISDSNRIFYVNEDDGCLYERGAETDKLKLKIADVEKSEVSFFKENVDDETDDFYSDEGLEDSDDTFSSEVGAAEEEIAAVEQGIINNETDKEKTVEQNVDDMLADIMGDEKARNEVHNEDAVAVGDKESQVLSEMMDCMNDKPAPANDVKITEEELEKLFASHESEAAKEEEPAADENELDSKTQILIDSVKLSKIIECEPKGTVPADPDLFIIAEATVAGENGEVFTEKLEKVSRRFAEIQDFKRIIMIAGLPVENDEFMQFFHHYISLKNVVLACTAPSPSKLSPYAKTICEEARIALDKETLLDQRKKIGIKNDNLIKLVIQDVPNS